MTTKQQSWILETQEDPVTGDTILQLPTDMMFFLDWREGDRLDYTIKDDQVLVRNLDAEARDQSRQSSISENTK
jgi:hypothetical protein